MELWVLFAIVAIAMISALAVATYVAGGPHEGKLTIRKAFSRMDNGLLVIGNKIL